MRALAVAVSLIIGLAQASLAFEFPALYRVIDVASNDVLNVRAAPDAQSEIIGEFQHDQSGIEIVALSDDRGWGQVNVGGQSGWTSMRFLQREAEATSPLRAECFGTEPFWNLTLGATHVLREPGQGSQPYQATAELSAANTTNSIAILGHSPAGNMTATIDAAQCSDGMSDRLFGLSIGLVLTGGDSPRYLTGCCSLAP
ncbi:COG3650 family protein [Pseudosulfitobacter koreensis]|uniref:SH3 domain-containing protein n=1 Tax=Pseudosulfitobacter koreensis TaxID=2968472 RepID=A0ABT1Z4X5_9RHOB|nr:SH3 domain-containing protein [Pseudosulfitobacter koreense]MCR8828187.1 SH3 domain-containing protein [Pseudosulfitobacter koreense]